MAKVLLLLAVLVLVLACHSSTHVGVAADQPVVAHSVPPGAAREFLNAHNAERAEVGVRPLKWSNDLADAAFRLVRHQKNYKRCALADMAGRQYGGNQMWSPYYHAQPAREVVEYWVNRGSKHYNNAYNYCAMNQKYCDSYTQVVWERTVMLGCAQGICARHNGSLSICFYYPPGNVQGQRPY